MTTPARISAWAVTLFLTLCNASYEPAHAFCLWGFGQCERASPIAGEYVQDGNSAKTLTITANKVTAKTGPVSYSVDYTVKSVDGKNVTIEVSESKETLQVQVEKFLIKIRNNPHFAGDWKKRVASP